MPEQLAVINAGGGDVTLFLVGLGHLGGHFLSNLSFIAAALQEVQGRRLDVCAFDPRPVTPEQLTTHRLGAEDLGRNLARALVSRISRHSGYGWQGYSTLPDKLPFYNGTLQILVTALDSAAAREEAWQWSRRQAFDVWLDLGHDDYGGQAVLGWTGPDPQLSRLPTLRALFPQALSHSSPPPAAPPPAPLVNLNAELVSTLGARLLWAALQPTPLTHHGYFVNTETGAVNALSVAPYVAREAG